MESILEWRPITNFQGYQLSGYQLSESGFVLSNKKNKNRILTSYVDCGITIVQLYIDSCHRRKFRLHVLVATIFVPNPLNYKFIIFKDGNSLNYHKNNLKWTNDPYLNDSQGHWEDMKDFSAYEICRSGIRIKETKQPIKISDYEYPKVSLTDDNSKMVIFIYTF